MSKIVENQVESENSAVPRHEGTSSSQLDADISPEFQISSKTQDLPKAQVITVSDRCASGEREDRSGPLAAKLLGDIGFESLPVAVVPDGIESVQAAIRAAIKADAKLIFTTGGTGVGPHDFTPEATRDLLAATLDGLAQQIREAGLGATPYAIISRGLVGVTSRDQDAAVVVNAPGSTGGVKDAVKVLAPVIHHILDQLVGGDH